MKNIFEGLNEQQEEVAKFNEGIALVVAVAGSGKTKTLVHRVANLLTEGVSPSEIMLVTFTNKAANEILARTTNIINSLGIPVIGSVKGGTFHSIANGYLRRYASLLGMTSDFIILDPDDSESIIKLAIHKNYEVAKDNTNYEWYQLLVKQAGQYYNAISYAKNKDITYSTAIEERFDPEVLCPEIMDTLYEEYKQYTITNNMMDYDQLLLNFYKLLVEHPEVCSKISSEIRYLIVDEYQDTNALQSNIIKLLISTHNNLMVVGDPYQSIYGFRGAYHKFILEFPEQYKQCTVFKLEYNYRSLQSILDVGQHILELAGNQFKAQLTAVKKNATKYIPEWVEVYNEFSQAKYVAQELKRIDTENRPHHCALIRNNRQSMFLERELTLNKIPYVKYGGLRFMELAHIKDFCACIRVYLNIMDELALQRIIPLIPSVGSGTANKIFKVLDAGGTWEGALSKIKLTEKTKNAVEALLKFRNTFNKKDLTISEILDMLVEFYLPLIKENYTENYKQRELDLKTMLDISREYDSLSLLLQDFSLDPNLKNEDNANKVIISTIHSAKGLEWDSVYILQATNDTYPHPRCEKLEELEEDKRLFYVAVTRAKTKLVILTPKFNARMEELSPTLYLQDIKNLFKISKPFIK